MLKHLSIFYSITHLLPGKIFWTPWAPSVHHLLSFTLDDDTNCGYCKQEAKYRKEIPLDFTFVMEDTSLWRIMQWMVEYHYVLSLFFTFSSFWLISILRQMVYNTTLFNVEQLLFRWKQSVLFDFFVFKISERNNTSWKRFSKWYLFCSFS